MKQLTLVIFALIGVFSFAQFANDPLVPTLRNFGSNFVLNKALESKKISDTNFALIATNSITKKSTTTYHSYTFNITLNNTNGDIIQTAFEVRYTIQSQAKSVRSYSYRIAYASTPVTPTEPTTPTTPTTPQPDEDGFVAINASEYSTALIQELAIFGKDHIVAQAVSKGKLPAGIYTVKSINSVANQTLSDGVSYKFDINFVKSDGAREVETVFVVKVTSATGAKEVRSYSLSVLPYSTDANTPTTPTTPTTPQPDQDGYVSIPASQYSTALIQDLAVFGKDYVVAQAISKGKLPSGNYSVKSINSAAKQVIADGTNYKFDINFVKSDGAREVETVFVIKVTSSTKQVRSYSLNVLPFKA